MTAQDARNSRAFVLEVAKAAKCRRRAVERVLDGLEVWPATYDRVAVELRGRGVEDVPGAAARAPRVPPGRPCRACEAKDDEIEVLMIERDLDRAELAKVRADYQQALVVATEFREECHRMKDERDEALKFAEDEARERAASKDRWAKRFEEWGEERSALRARVAELEAHPVGGSSVGGSLAVVPIGPEAPTPAADPPTAEAPTPPRPPPQPDDTTQALARAVGRKSTVRLDMGDGVLVRAAEVAR